MAMTTTMNSTRTHALALAACTLAAFALACACMAALPAQAHAAKAVNKQLLSYTTWSSSGDYSGSTTKTFKKYDITGNGKADTLKIEAGAYKVRLYVNGKLRKTVKSNGAFQYEVTYLRTNGKHPFLYVAATYDNGDGAQRLLQYQNGTFKVIAKEGGFTDARWVTAKATGKNVKVTYQWDNSYTTGCTYLTYTYKWKRGMLKRTSRTTSNIHVHSLEAGMGSVKKPWLTLQASVKIYKTAGGKKRVATVKTGAKLKVVAITVKKGNKVYFKVKTKAGKTGWMAERTDYLCNSDGSYIGNGNLFAEVGGVA